MKSLHDIGPNIPPLYLQGAWAVHCILVGPGNPFRYEFAIDTTDGALKYRQTGTQGWSRLSTGDLAAFQRPDDILRRGPYRPNIEEQFIHA